MTLTADKHPQTNSLKLWAFFLICMALFCLAYSQAPLFYSNQNQYFLHGFAKADLGILNEDWLANTKDPTPLFSNLVCITMRYSHQNLFHLYYALLQCVYLSCAWFVFHSIDKSKQRSLEQYAIFTALFFLIHSAAIRWLSYRVLGNDYPWFFQAGVAGQYILGAMFQPSNFGVFLLLGLCLFLKQQHFVATFFICLAGILHSTYLLGGAFIILGFQIYFLFEGKVKKTITVGLFALLLVTPSVIYAGQNFQPTSFEGFKEAQEFLVYFRLPHHCLPDLWCDWVALLQIIWIVFSIYLLRKKREVIIVLVPFLLGTVLTLLQVATKNNSLALLFPWRISSVLVPFATILILSQIVSFYTLTSTKIKIFTPSLVILFILAGLGIAIPIFNQGFFVNENENGILSFIKDHSKKSDQYLLPVKIPNLASTTKGSLSSDFKPLAKKKTDIRIVPIDMQRFRLSTQAPLFIDFKSIPYRDEDVLIWHKRLLQADNWNLKIAGNNATSILEELKENKISHLITPSKIELDFKQFELLYLDDNFQLWKIKESLNP